MSKLAEAVQAGCHRFFQWFTGLIISTAVLVLLLDLSFNDWTRACNALLFFSWLMLLTELGKRAMVWIVVGINVEALYD